MRETPHRIDGAIGGFAHLRVHDGAVDGDRQRAAEGMVRAFEDLVQTSRDVVLVIAHDLQYLGMRGTELGRGIQEGAPAEFLAVEPVAQRERQRVDLRGAGRQVGRQTLSKPPHPAFVAELEIGHHQQFLARIVPIERHLGDSGGFDDLVDPGGADALPVKQGMGRMQDAFTGRERVGGGSVACHDAL